MEKPGAEPPGIYRLFSLCVIYRLSFRELLEIYGLDLNEITRLQMEIQLPQTHLISPDVHDLNRRIAFPEKINPELDVGETHLLSRMVQTWGEIPLAFLQHLGIKKRLYGYIGMKDFTLHPFIPPGSLVQMTTVTQEFSHAGGRPTLIGPSTILQLREGFACGWCQVDGGNLSIISLFCLPADGSQIPVPGRRRRGRPSDRCGDVADRPPS